MTETAAPLEAITHNSDLKNVTAGLYHHLTDLCLEKGFIKPDIQKLYMKSWWEDTRTGFVTEPDGYIAVLEKLISMQILLLSTTPNPKDIAEHEVLFSALLRLEEKSKTFFAHIPTVSLKDTFQKIANIWFVRDYLKAQSFKIPTLSYLDKAPDKVNPEIQGVWGDIHWTQVDDTLSLWKVNQDE
jgi:hypothetical protein